jgi:hypothetical protein
LIEFFLRRGGGFLVDSWVDGGFGEVEVGFFEEIFVELLESDLFLGGDVFELVDLALLLSEADLQFVNFLF